MIRNKALTQFAALELRQALNIIDAAHEQMMIRVNRTGAETSVAVGLYTGARSGINYERAAAVIERVKTAAGDKWPARVSYVTPNLTIDAPKPKKKRRKKVKPTADEKDTNTDT